MRTLIKIIVLFLTSAFCTHAFCVQEAVMQDFVAGNEMYGLKRYAEAINYYQKAMAQGKTVALFFNLANAYAQDYQVGLAVLNYRRALLYAPRNADVQANLTFLHEQESIADFPPAFAQSMVTYLTHTTWLYVAVVLFWIFLFLSLGGFYYSYKNKYVICVIVISLIGCLFATYATYLSARLDSHAIVISQSVLKLAPTTKSEDLVALKPGQEVELLSEYQNYAQIRLANQIEGWVKKNTIEQILSAN